MAAVHVPSRNGANYSAYGKATLTTNPVEFHGFTTVGATHGDRFQANQL